MTTFVKKNSVSRGNISSIRSLPIGSISNINFPSSAMPYYSYSQSSIIYPPDSPTGLPRYGGVFCDKIYNRWIISCDDWNDYRGKIWYYVDEVLVDEIEGSETHNRLGSFVGLSGEYASAGASWQGGAGPPGAAYIYKADANT